MEKYKRKLFFLRENFQIHFICSFILFVFVEVIFAAWYIYRLAYLRIEEYAALSHMPVDSAAEVLGPVILKVNACVIVISIIIGFGAAFLSYKRLQELFGRIILGLNELKDNKTRVRLSASGGRNSRELIEEFNQAASCLAARTILIKKLTGELIHEKNIDQIEKIHNDLYSLLAQKDSD